MNISIRNALSVASPLLVCTVACADVVEERTIQERFAIDDANAFLVVVENVFGAIRIAGYDGDTVEMTAIETIRADTQEQADRARTEIQLRSGRDGRRIEFIVDMPDNNCDCRRGWRRRGYTVTYDIDMRVPRSVTLDVSTINNGDIGISGVHGPFQASNVNGDVTLRGLRRAGHAETINGKVTADFETVPDQAVTFETLNGDVDVTFPEGLSAVLRLRTVHGDLWTDFDVSSLPRAIQREVQADGRLLIQADSHTAVRVGTGGPTHTFETMNGEVYIRRAN